MEHDPSKCRELALDLLCDYYEGDLPEPTARQLEVHVEHCRPCAALLNTYRKTTELSRAALRAEIPKECEHALHEFLNAHLPGCGRGTD
ncbi:MAG: zf-HC2 domain-containing protein [Deltaproteobacteria bacterium]|nr:zf-HC2 domain-containing protein [Deltaproteobacteria bacterium]